MSRPPFRIEKLRIENFRGIDQLTLSFPGEGAGGGVAVLAGDNGCGKTAVLEAILIVLGRMDLLPADDAPFGEQVRFGAADFQIEVELGPVSTGVPRALRADRETWRVFNGNLGRVPGAVGAFAPEVEYFSVRRGPRDLGHTPEPRSAGSEREAHRIIELKHRLVSVYYRGLRQRQKDPSEQAPFERLQRFVSRFLGEDWILDVIPVSNDPGSGDEVVIRRGGELPPDVTSLAMARNLAKDRSDIPTLIPLERLSSGQVALFTFAGPLIFRDEPADVVLIDEPEQHLHPSWQRLLVDALRQLSPESQFIIATHSLEILDSVCSYERHLLLAEDDPRARDWQRPEPPQQGIDPLG
jgi:energy-coupling factor transporter ATP-binding protein EcfA2